MAVILDFRPPAHRRRPRRQPPLWVNHPELAPRPLHPGRMFHLPAEGWYVRTREGTAGPFATLDGAEAFLAALTAPRPEG